MKTVCAEIISCCCLVQSAHVLSSLADGSAADAQLVYFFFLHRFDHKRVYLFIQLLKLSTTTKHFSTLKESKLELRVEGRVWESENKFLKYFSNFHQLELGRIISKKTVTSNWFSPNLIFSCFRCYGIDIDIVYDDEDDFDDYADDDDDLFCQQPKLGQIYEAVWTKNRALSPGTWRHRKPQLRNKNEETWPLEACLWVRTDLYLILREPARFR